MDFITLPRVRLVSSTFLQEEGVMNFLSVERAGEIASICQRNVLEVKSDAEWTVATNGVDRQVIDFSTTWALLMQVSKKSLHQGSADETIGEALQYCNIPRFCEAWNAQASHDQKLDLFTPLKVVSKAVEILGAGWGYGILLQKWWNANPPTKRLLMRK